MKHVETRLEDDTATPVSCYPGRHGDDFSGGGGFGPYGRALPTRRAGAVADAWDDWIMGNLQKNGLVKWGNWGYSDLTVTSKMIFSCGQIPTTSHTRGLGPQNVAEGKWDPAKFREILVGEIL